jgi:hypothetical protein
MNLEQLQTATGFKSMVACWKMIQEMHREDSEKITFIKGKPVAVIQIKAAALDEMQNLLPVENTIIVMHEIVADNCPHGPDKSLIHQFLNNLQTK